MISVNIKEMLECGVHFGHPTRRWNPKMKKYIFGERNGVSIIDLQKTARSAKKALQFIFDTAANGGKVLFVGTKRQAIDVVKEQAERSECYYVNHRWLGGLMTNFVTIQQSIKRLMNLENMLADESRTKGLKKKELLKLDKQRARLDRVLHGIKDMKRLPSILFVVDVQKEHIAIAEANKLEIPVVAIVDTNCDPDKIDYIIPGNDDAIRSISLFSERVADAVLEGSKIYKTKKAEEEARKAEERAKIEKQRAEERAKRDRERKEKEKLARQRKAEQEAAKKKEAKQAKPEKAEAKEPETEVKETPVAEPAKKPSRATKKPAKAEPEKAAKEEKKEEKKKEPAVEKPAEEKKEVASEKPGKEEKKEAKAEKKPEKESKKEESAAAKKKETAKEKKAEAKPAKKAESKKPADEKAEAKGAEKKTADKETKKKAPAKKAEKKEEKPEPKEKKAAPKKSAEKKKTDEKAEPEAKKKSKDDK